MRTYNLEKYKHTQPSRVIEVLESLGWQEFQSMPGVVSIWGKNQEQQEWKILLPLDPDSPDYPNRMIEAIKVVSHFEDKDEHEVLEKIINNSIEPKG
ncbi:MAG: hypothetical protein F6K30_26375 [Cyanothece sp. SIO2G6]|nr:hypothetical protein [Cyanothece sp. SIO2G6]